jgi:hypothetical protein
MPNGIVISALPLQVLQLTITGYTGIDGNLDIPGTITVCGTDYTVTAIGDRAFTISPAQSTVIVYNTAINSVTIPDTVTSIGTYAFLACPNITSIDIPDSVTTVGYEAFEYCLGLTDVTISKNMSNLAPGL